MLVEWGFALFSGLTLAMAGFLVAAGLTLVFGVLKILNFSHGAFFMIGAYVTYSIIGSAPATTAWWLVGSLGGGLAVGALGLATDLLVFRRLRGVDEHTALIATFAVLLVVGGLAKLVWGVDFRSVRPPPALDDTIAVGGMLIPIYSLVVIGAGILVFVVLDWALHRSRAGKLVQAVARDSWMADVLGINTGLVMTVAVVISFALAGLAGGLLLPNQSLFPGLGDVFLLFAFNAVIMGGLGNVRGAFIASIVLGLVESTSAVLLPDMPSITLYLALIAFILIKPHGLFRQPAQASATIAGLLEHRATGSRMLTTVLMLAVAAGLAALPFTVNDGALFIAGLAIIEALFALSWNLLFRYAGIASFGHGAFFAAGAYLVGAAQRHGWPLPFPAQLLAALLLGGIAAAVLGAAALRRVAGIHFAILTLAAAEVLRIVLSSASSIGGDEGLSGIPRPVLHLLVADVPLRSAQAYYLFILAVAALFALGLLWLVSSRTGRALRSIAQDPERAAFIGLDIYRLRVLAFAVAGAVAALCGGLSAPWVQIVTPDLTYWLHSAQPMLNTLLGGAGAFWGPVLGALVYAGIDYSTRTMAGASELVIGAILLAIILIAPTGIAGGLAASQAWVRRLARGVEPPATPLLHK